MVDLEYVGGVAEVRGWLVRVVNVSFAMPKIECWSRQAELGID